MSAACPYAVHFGGPDLPPRQLSGLLAERTDAVPSGGEIHWITYYFRDRVLADALLRARRRGVEVRVTVEGRPRTAHANETLLERLGGADGLGDGLRAVVHAPSPPRRRPPLLHEKLYCFSHPNPTAFVGSFNPSGDGREEEPDVIREIGDQDRGHNFLVELRDASVVGALVAHARHLHAARHGCLERFTRSANHQVHARDLRIHFWPRLLPNPILRALLDRARGSSVRIAASHIKGPTAARILARLARRGARVAILTEETHRRVPPRMMTHLADAGIDIRRVIHPDGLPMHNKFVLVERADGTRWVAFGSLNWTERSLRLNHEIGAICTDAEVFDRFAARWTVLQGQADARGDSVPSAESGPVALPR